MTFEDIFGGFDDFSDQPDEQNSDEWDTGDLWDSGEKENIWRSQPASAPGDVWKTDINSGGCNGCNDPCEDECGIPVPVEEFEEDEFLDEEEFDEDLDDFDEMLEDDEEPSESSVFDDIF